MTNHQSKIEKLIAELAPNGVEFKYIWEVTAWDKKFNAVENQKQKKIIKYNYLLASELKNLQVEDGNIKLLTTNNSELYTTEELAGAKISEGEVVAIPWGGTANVQYYKGKFLTADNRLATSLDANYLDNKYLYYVMLSRTREIQSFYRGSGIKHPSMAKVLDMKIPIPPIDIQQEIVNILDKFTSLEAELEAELEARKQQYEHYRAQLLTFNDSNEGGVEWTRLGDAYDFQYGTGNKIPTDGGTYPVYGSNGKVGMHHTYNSEDAPVIGHIGAYAGIVNWASGKHFVTYNGVICKIKKGILPKFGYHLLMKQDLRQLAKDGSQPFVSYDKLKKVPVQIPPINIQEQIVSILNKFESLTNDISIGLPAELNARRQQYEYYRNKLLTFSELKQ